jgi:hypothetical protein
MRKFDEQFALPISFIIRFYFPHISEGRLRVCSTGAEAGVDSAWEQRKLEARKILENAAESPASSAYYPGARAGRFVRRD